MDFASLACVIWGGDIIKIQFDMISQAVCPDGGGGQTGLQVHALDLAHPGSLAVLCAS